MADQVSALEPGLYKATVHGVPDTTVLISTSQGAGFTSEVIGEWRTHLREDITDARPLIALDLGEDPSHVKYVVDVLRNARHMWTNDAADQIARQTKPARIPEPGHIGASVKAASDDGLDVVRPWTRFSTILLANWIDADGRKRKWVDLIDPTLIREGVS